MLGRKCLLSLAWDAFRTSNGAPTLLGMRKRIAFYRNQADDPRQDYMIGCRILTQPFFFPEQQWIQVPSSWSPHIQQGRTYDTSEADGRRFWEAVLERESQLPAAPIAVPRYGEPALIRPRLGQGAFRVTVTDVYQRRCAVTGERTLPILDAAHIRPFGDGGETRNFQWTAIKDRHPPPVRSRCRNGPGPSLWRRMVAIPRMMTKRGSG